MYQSAESCPRTLLVNISAIDSFIVRNKVLQFALSLVCGQILQPAHTKMKHWIELPFFLKVCYHQPIEKILSALPICLEGAAQQRLAKSAWPGEKYISILLQQVIDQVSLVNIQQSILTNLYKVVCVNWIYKIAVHIHLSGAKISDIFENAKPSGTFSWPFLIISFQTHQQANYLN